MNMIPLALVQMFNGHRFFFLLFSFDLCKKLRVLNCMSQVMLQAMSE